MTEKMDDLINRYLDGLLTPPEEAELNGWIKLSPENAEKFANAASLDNHLGDLIRADKTLEIRSASTTHHATPMGKQNREYGFLEAGWVGGLTTIAVMLAFFLWWMNPRSVNASAEMDRLIKASSKSPDRTYLISNLDAFSEKVDDRQPPIEGAILYVRQPDQYVLVRKFADGRKYLTGSDGEQSWSMPPWGAVRASANPLRFRGPVPGNQHGIPFVNLRSDLVQIRDAYFISLIGPETNGLQKLLAEKKSSDHRGPNRIELWYDPETVVIQRMVFEGLPQAKGGPNKVFMELIDQDVLAPDFFRHDYHHGKDAKVIIEDY